MLIVYLDPGHGVDTPGKRSPKWDDGTQLLEFEFNRDIAKRIDQRSRGKLWACEVIVKELTDIPLSARRKRIAKGIISSLGNTSLTISLHGNAARAASARGVEVFTWPGQTRSDEFAEILFDAFAKIGRKMRSDSSDGDKDKEARFGILKCKGPAVLAEFGFYTNYKECKWMQSDEGRNRIADTCIRAIDTYHDTYETKRL